MAIFFVEISKKKSPLLVLAKKQPLVRQSIAKAYKPSLFPYFLERATTRAVSVIVEIMPRKSLTEKKTRACKKL